MPAFDDFQSLVRAIVGHSCTGDRRIYSDDNPMTRDVGFVCSCSERFTLPLTRLIQSARSDTSGILCFLGRTARGREELSSLLTRYAQPGLTETWTPSLFPSLVDVFHVARAHAERTGHTILASEAEGEVGFTCADGCETHWHTESDDEDAQESLPLQAADINRMAREYRDVIVPLLAARINSVSSRYRENSYLVAIEASATGRPPPFANPEPSPPKPPKQEGVSRFDRTLFDE